MRPNLPFVSAKHTLVTYNNTLSLITKTNQGPRCFQRRPKQPDQPRRLTGPAGRGSRHGLTTLGVVSAVSAMLPRPRGSVPRPPGGGLGTSAMARRPRAPQAHSSLGRAVHHHQDFEARNIQAGQQSRRGLQQRLEHPTATLLLPLRCFQVVHIPRSLYIHK
jgi:hypothetical protein